MIGTALQLVSEGLNQHLCQRLKVHPSANKVQLSSIVDANGNLTVKDNNVLLLKLINIEPNYIATGAGSISPNVNDRLVTSPPLYLNLRIIIAAYFQPEQIQMGLNMLSLGMAYLQSRPLWTPQNTPNLSKGINRLVFEMETLDYNQLNHVWGAIGTKYLPSAMYKMKMIAIDNGDIQQKMPIISKLSTDTNKT